MVNTLAMHMRTLLCTTTFGALPLLPLLLIACSSSSGGATASSDSGTSGNDASTGTDSSQPTLDSSTGSDASATDSGASADTSTASKDSSTEGEASAPWTPTALGSQLAFWLDPSSIERGDGGVEGGVAGWNDLSGNGNNAYQHTGSQQPTYDPDGPNGLAAISFTPGASGIACLLMNDAPSLQWGTGDFSIFAVIRGDSHSSALAMLYQKTGSPNFDGANFYLVNRTTTDGGTENLATIQVAGNTYLESTPPPSSFIDGSVHLIGGLRVGSTLQVRVDGVASSSTAADAGPEAGLNDDVSAVNSLVGIGQNCVSAASGFQQYAGDIAEMLAIHGTLSASDLASVEAYLKTKYAIP
jgi:hypothetical protein